MLSVSQIRHAERISADYEGLAAEYAEPFARDRILGRITTSTERALVWRIAVEEQLLLRGAAVAEHAVPAGRSLPRVLAQHKIWTDSGGRNGVRADLSGADLRGADFIGITLQGSILDGADLTGADLRHANLRGAVLRNAILVKVDFRGTDMRGVDLSRSHPDGAGFNRWTRGGAEALAKEFGRGFSNAAGVDIDRSRHHERDIGPAR